MTIDNRTEIRITPEHQRRGGRCYAEVLEHLCAPKYWRQCRSAGPFLRSPYNAPSLPGVHLCWQHARKWDAIHERAARLKMIGESYG